MGEDRQALLARISDTLAPQIAETIESRVKTDKFAPEFYEMVLQHCYGTHWLRPGLALRDRSMVTLAFLIGSGQFDELPAHSQFALKNGCTIQEIEEIVYHATAYTGFPKAHTARGIIEKALVENDIL